ncbi:class I SAM-dependent methyltransferase [Streptomyces shenzhenensis]|uniref:class I SAM-dependent methyltransferase n=1 Tax=Streptomyces shenzhenensis TaxID=943815 RepID=UPI003D930C73
MLALDLPDGGLAGVVAWYSISHTPVDRLPALFAQFFRVPAPGGQLLPALQVGDEPLRPDRPSLDFHHSRPDHMAGLLEQAGFSVRARLDRAPDLAEGESTHLAFLIAARAAG